MRYYTPPRRVRLFVWLEHYQFFRGRLRVLYDLGKWPASSRVEQGGIVAQQIELAMEPLMSVKAVCKALGGIDRATVYRNKWLMQRRIKVGSRVMWEPSDIRLYKALHSANRRAPG